MRKNKTIAFALAAMICVGAGALGTKAWFADNAEVKNNLTVTMGDLNVEAKATDWLLYRVDANGAYPTTGVAIDANTRLQPGDKIKRTVTISNEGSLAQNIKVTQTDAGTVENYGDLISLNDDGLKGLTTKLEAKGTVSKDLVITISEGMLGKHKDATNTSGFNGDKTAFDLQTIAGQYTINATQTNAPTAK